MIVKTSSKFRHLLITSAASISGIFLWTACGLGESRSSAFEQEGLAAVRSPEERFQVLIGKIETNLIESIQGGLTDKDVSRLSLGPIRKELLRLQNLADVYSERYPKVTEIRKHTKALEDAIGGYREVNEKLAFSKENGGTENDIHKLEKELEEASEELVHFIDKEGWKPKNGIARLESFETILASVNWDSPTLDKRFLFSALCETTLQVERDPWDMFIDLEDRYGLHRLKKDLRWQLLQIEVLNQDVLFTDDNGCERDSELSEIDRVIAESSALEAVCRVGGAVPTIGNLSEAGCSISKCYHSDLDSFYDLLSEVKDEGEGLTAIGKDLSSARRAEVQSRLKDLRDRGVLRKVAFELSSCVQDLDLNGND